VQEESGNPKTKTAFNFKHDDLSVETVRANDKASIKVAYPLSSDDWKVDGDASYELKAGKEEKITGAVHINSPDLSGALLAVNVSASNSSANRIRAPTSSRQRCNYKPKAGYRI
jgi:hypothetical protein